MCAESGKPNAVWTSRYINVLIKKDGRKWNPYLTHVRLNSAQYPTQRSGNFIGATPLWTVNAQQMFEITDVNSSLKTWQADWIYSSPRLETAHFCTFFGGCLFRRQTDALVYQDLLTFTAHTCHVIPACVYHGTLWIIATGLCVCV